MLARELRCPLWIPWVWSALDHLLIAFGIGLICNVELFSSGVIMGVVLFGGRGIIFPYIGFLFARQSRFPTGFLRDII